MKKRNRLLSSTPQSRIFSQSRVAQPKRRHLMLLSLLTVIGIFITTMVLATSEPAVKTSQSKVRLPDIGEEMGQLSIAPLQREVTSETTPHPAMKHDVAETDKPADIPNETNAVELIHLQQSLSLQNEDKRPVESIKTEEALDWNTFEVKSGDNLSTIFARAGLTARDVYEVAQSGDEIKPLLNLRPGQQVRFGFDYSDELKQIKLQLSPVETLTVSRTDEGFETLTEQREYKRKQREVVGQINSSLFLDGRKAGMSDRLIMQMAHVFGWDIDFALDLRQGDSFKVIFEENHLDGEKVSDGNILAAEFTNRGKTFRAIRYTDDNGDSAFYAPDGASMRKAFTRTPVPVSRISSRFNPNRKHPVLNTNRPHRGVDYAAATGTPILSTGDGRVDFVGNKGGYGKTIVLSHAGKYTTLYAHMSRFKSGIKRGQRVKQGDTIGYIGSTGLATGPHLHYEFRVNGVHKDPLKVALPEAEPIADKYLADFKARSQPLLASLEALQVPLLALNKE